MFGLFKKNEDSGKKRNKIVLKISGLHCTSCTLNIDGELEDLKGVHEASTSYARSETKVVFDNEKTSEKEISSTVEKLGYKVLEIIGS